MESGQVPNFYHKKDNFINQKVNLNKNRMKMSIIGILEQKIC